MDINTHTGLTKRNRRRIDLSLDYHSHILPCCDHGSDGLKTSLEQVRCAMDVGIRTICATPHFYPNKEGVNSFLQRRDKAYRKLKRNLPPDSPRILPGAEVLICEGMEHMEDIRRLCLAGTDELLLELPFYKWPEQVWDTLFELKERDDISIVIAHADRYPARDIEILIDEGFRLQLNAACLSKLFGQKRYMTWIEKGFVDYLGSDIHMLGRGYEDFEKAVSKLRHAKK